MTRFSRSLAFALPLVFLAPIGCADAADPPVVKSFDSNGIKIAYFTQGKGEPVVLIHGWTSSAGINWALPGTSGHLAKDYQVIALDVRGHGLSDKPTKDDAYGAELVEDVVRLLDHLKIKKAHIVGYSMGGIITAKFVSKHPDRVLSATLSGMGWLKEGDLPQAFFAQIGKSDSTQSAVALCGRSLAKLALSKDEVKSIKVPVTVIVGEKDDLIKKLYVEPLRKVRTDWPVVEVKDGDHLSTVIKPQFREEIAMAIKKMSK
jgi:pimeloyl-ACP methyl ester carboxylesterase